MTETVEVKIKLEHENYRLFYDLLDVIEKEAKALDHDFNVARNLASSRWDVENGELMPVEIFPETTELLKKNYEILRRRISLRKYLLVKAFYPTLGKFGRNLKGWDDLIEYWDEEVKNMKE